MLRSRLLRALRGLPHQVGTACVRSENVVAEELDVGSLTERSFSDSPRIVSMDEIDYFIDVAHGRIDLPLASR